MQTYSNPERQNDEHALPDVEVFYARPIVIECPYCGNSVAPWGGEYDKATLTCPSCGHDECTGRFDRNDAGHYWYWSCSPGCLPDSDPIGPFETEDDAIADAQGE